MKIPALVLIALLAIASSATAQNKPRLLVTASETWYAAGGFSESHGNASGVFLGGSEPKTVEVIDQFAKRCPAIVVTNNRDLADYVALFDYSEIGKHNKIAVFKRNGDLVYSGKTFHLGNTVKDVCSAIGKIQGK